MTPETAIVMTSIFPPTPAVRAFARIPGCRLTVVGDRKTPDPWHCEGAVYLSPQAQCRAAGRLAELLPWNHYCRKMLGYLKAVRDGARVIVDTDDDNEPFGPWGFPPFDGRYECVADGQDFVNVYRHFTDANIWPRGYPLDRIRTAEAAGGGEALAAEVRVGIWQGLVDGDPDVDAVYRLTVGRECRFRQRPPLVLGRGTFCPFNSQHTAFRREVFTLLYLPACVSFRFTDILRGLVAQPMLWALGYRLGFAAPTVVQERNPHDYLRDFESEIPCYLHPHHVVEAAQSCVRPGIAAGDYLMAVYERLHARYGIVPREELPILAAWLQEMGEAGARAGGEAG